MSTNPGLQNTSWVILENNKVICIMRYNGHNFDRLSLNFLNSLKYTYLLHSATTRSNNNKNGFEYPIVLWG